MGDAKLAPLLREIRRSTKPLIFFYFLEVPNWHLKLFCPLEGNTSSLREGHEY
jgi:hypothetical protein